MPNVQWMSYSFVRLYLSKCHVCVLNHIWINPKRFLIILYVLEVILSLFLFMFSAYFVFHCLNMFCFEKQVLEFLATHFGYLRELLVLATHFGDLQVTSPSYKFTQNSFVTHSRLSSRLASRETPRISLLKSFFMGNLF